MIGTCMEHKFNYLHGRMTYSISILVPSRAVIRAAQISSTEHSIHVSPFKGQPTGQCLFFCQSGGHFYFQLSLLNKGEGFPRTSVLFNVGGSCPQPH